MSCYVCYAVLFILSSELLTLLYFKQTHMKSSRGNVYRGRRGGAGVRTLSVFHSKHLVYSQLQGPAISCLLQVEYAEYARK